MIDLRSDTVTRPSDAMREAAANAEVGDDVYREDPTINELEARAADLAGMEAALYCPSGTMCNQVAARTHTEPGQEALVDVESHIYKWELAGLAQHSHLQARTVDAGGRAVPTPEQLRTGYVAPDGHRAGTGLIAVENTHNSRGGVAVPPERIDAAGETARELGVPIHLDGARLPNAAVAHDVPVSRMTRAVDSAMFCLSKGLGAPVGSVLCGPAAFIEDARRVRKLFGGGMRQGGIIAAPGLEALGNVDRLAEDHERATRLAAALDDLPGLSVPTPDTNIVLVDTQGTGHTAGAFLERCADAGVRGTEFGEYTVRFCTHLDVDDDDVAAAIDRVSTVLGA